MREAIIARAKARAALKTATGGAGKTKDGHAVQLLANIGAVEDAERAAKEDVEGVGLFRTEVLFLDSATAPTVADQVKAYTKVFEAFGDRKVVIRTLDAGADKPLAFAPSEEEENPALGVRGYRMDRVFPQLLDDQLEAIAQAAKATGATVWVMAPMVSTVHEAKAFTDKVRSHGLPVAGMMVEVPAAALRARHMMDIVDFASIGTNDLTQYAMATDRMAGELAELLDPWQPAVLDLIAATGAAGQGRRQGGRGVRRGRPRSAAGPGAGRARHHQPVDGAVRCARRCASRCPAPPSPTCERWPRPPATRRTRPVHGPPWRSWSIPRCCSRCRAGLLSPTADVGSVKENAAGSGNFLHALGFSSGLNGANDGDDVPHSDVGHADPGTELVGPRQPVGAGHGEACVGDIDDLAPLPAPHLLGAVGIDHRELAVVRPVRPRWRRPWRPPPSTACAACSRRPPWRSRRPAPRPPRPHRPPGATGGPGPTRPSLPQRLRDHPVR